MHTSTFPVTPAATRKNRKKTCHLLPAEIPASEDDDFSNITSSKMRVLAVDVEFVRDDVSVTSKSVTSTRKTEFEASTKAEMAEVSPPVDEVVKR